MSVETRSSEVFRFGTFEVDVRAGELRKQGVRIKLQEQPFHVLTVLLQRPSEVVTREELRSQNWPADTFVDFDNSLNTAINKLREALGDSADNPRFIETLPRRGYRFIAPVTGVDGSTRGTAAGVPARPRSRKIIVTVAVVVLAAGIAGGLFWRSRQTRKLTDKDTIVQVSATDPQFAKQEREKLKKSKLKFERQLDRAWATDLKKRVETSVGAPGAEAARKRLRRIAKQRTRQVVGRRAKVGVVEDVEKLSSEAKLKLLC
jgi:DNA-binding winged helix-turn-helix (wHTH) protein